MLQVFFEELDTELLTSRKIEVDYQSMLPPSAAVM